MAYYAKDSYREAPPWLRPLLGLSPLDLKMFRRVLLLDKAKGLTSKIRSFLPRKAKALKSYLFLEVVYIYNYGLRDWSWSIPSTPSTFPTNRLDKIFPKGCYRLIIFRKSFFLHFYRITYLNGNSTRRSCCLEFPFKLSDKNVNKRDFLTIINLCSKLFARTYDWSEINHEFGL